MARAIKLFVFLTLVCAPAFANSGMQLDLWVYGSAQGHGLGPETYLAEFRLPTESESACAKLATFGATYFKSGRLPDNSVTLGSASCEPAP